ncbi:hypothetical protein AOG2_13350 [Geobacter sp. AOG2]|nr:hypothetical protein AOG2_13350 [Geobacter sp. AOG2]
MRHHVTKRLVIFTLPLFLLFLGVRVPNVERPHKPKPMLLRAVLEAPAEKPVLQTSAKHFDAPVELGCSIHKVSFPISRPLALPIMVSSVFFLLLVRLLSPRAPPIHRNDVTSRNLTYHLW